VEPDRVAFTGDDLRKWLDLGFELAASSGMDFSQQVDAMVRAGVPGFLAAPLVNLIPILAGRRFLAASGPSPRLADHYVLVDGQGNERVVRLAECPVCAAVEWRLDRLDPADILAIGVGSCEVVALNNLLNRMGPHATESAVETITIEAPRMGG
jgi:hypothetical protein